VRHEDPVVNAAPFRSIELSDDGIDAGGVRFATVKSAALRRRADLCWFATPGAERLRDVPVVILLHGAYGSHWAWPFKGRAHLTAARLVAAGALPPVALLMPSDGLWGDGSGFVAHADHDPERWIVEEVPAFAAACIPGCGTGSPLLVAGLSMGGWGALRFAGKHPRRFLAAAAHSAIVDASQFDPLVAEGRRGWSGEAADLSLAAALLQAAAPLPPIRFDCGRDDPFIEGNRRLHAELREAGVAHRYVERDGGHDWGYWTDELEATLRFFGRVLRGEPDPLQEDCA